MMCMNSCDHHAIKQVRSPAYTFTQHKTARSAFTWSSSKRKCHADYSWGDLEAAKSKICKFIQNYIYFLH